MHDRLAMLTGGARDVPSRQQTIRGAIDWSYELLDEAEQRLFRALGVFSGGWSVDAAESVFPDGHDAVSALESFVDKSLVGETIGPGGESRFAMLETIREYASEKLRASGEYDTGAASHADYYVAFVERFGYSMDEERDFIGLYPILIAEIDNVRRALSWSCDNANRTLALRLLAPMWQVWHWLGRQSEGAQWVSRALRIPGDAPPIVEAHAYRTAANLSLAGADKASNERCRRYYARAARLYREAGYDAGVQGCLSNIGITYANNGELEQAIRYFTHSYRVARAKDNHGASRLAVMNLSDAYFRAGDRARAVACAKKALELAHLSGAQSGVCHALYGYAKTLVDVGRLDEARPIAREAIEALIDPQTGVYMAVPMAHCVLLQARLGALAADHARVGRLLGIVEALAPIAELGFDWGHSEMYGRLVSEARSALGDDVYERECSTGASMPPEDIVAFVLSDA
ncbi:MAG: tetratricopeptide repeat protein [Spirochaetaceae bacterium]|nr:MAG: tetratricopeptide repeat protein [Spirochaetaceae bacterium]